MFWNLGDPAFCFFRSTANRSTRLLLFQPLQQDDEDPSPSTQRRRLGRLLLYDLQQVKEKQQTIFRENFREETAAILDAKFCHCLLDGTVVVGIVDASGDLSLMKVKLDETKNLYQCERLSQISVGEERLALSLDWSTGRDERSGVYFTEKNVQLYL